MAVGRLKFDSSGIGNSVAAATIHSVVSVVFNLAAAVKINSVAMVMFNSAAVAINSAAMAMGRLQCSSITRGNSAVVVINTAVTMMTAVTGDGSYYNGYGLDDTLN